MDAKKEYKEYLKKIVNLDEKELAKFFNCSEEAIYVGEINEETDNFTTIPYKVIIGDVNLANNMEIDDLGELKIVFGNVTLGGWGKIPSNVDSLGKLECIVGNFDCSFSTLTDLGELKYVDGDAIFEDSNTNGFGKLKYVGKDLIIKSKSINYSLNNIEYVGRNLDINGDEHIHDFGKLKYVGKDLIADYSALDRLDPDDAEERISKIEYIGGKVVRTNAKHR